MDGLPPSTDIPSCDSAPLQGPGPPAPRPRAWPFFAVVLALFVFPGALAQSANPLLGLTWSEVATLLLPAVVAAAGWNLRPGPALLLARRPTLAQAGLSVPVAIAGLMVAVPLANVWVMVLPQRVVDRFEQAISPLFAQPPLLAVAMAVIASVVAPFCEEAAFRGFILTALRARRPPVPSIAVAAVLFAVMHLDPVRFPALLVLGAVFGWLAWRAGSLWPAVIAHGVNNGLVTALRTSGIEQRASTSPRADAAIAAVALAFGVVALAVAGTLYARATPAPPPVEDALVVRDPADLRPGYDGRRLGAGLRRALLLAVLAFAIIVTLGALRR